MQRAAEVGSWAVEDGDHNVVLCCKAEGMPDRGRINDWRGEVIVVSRLQEIVAADKSNLPFVHCPIGH